MPKLTFSPYRFVIAGSFVLLLLLALAVRFAPHRRVQVDDPATSLTASTTDQAVTSVPEFTSATFASGDALKGLGPEWTFVRQEEKTAKDIPWIAGTTPTRESVVKLIGKDAQMLLEEADIADAKILEAALKSKKIKATKVADRDGYLVPMGDEAGGTGLLLKGETTVLIIQDVNSPVWPSAPSAELLNYIHSVRVP